MLSVTLAAEIGCLRNVLIPHVLDLSSKLVWISDKFMHLLLVLLHSYYEKKKIDCGSGCV